MNTILDYLNTMFDRLPNTNEMQDLKQELRLSMEDKYHELKQSGKSEHEAIGTVISEFGNIDELIKEFDLPVSKNEESRPLFSEEQVGNFLRVIKRGSAFIGLGVSLCLIGVSLLILTIQLIDGGIISGLTETASDLIGLLPLFLLIATAVGMFIYASVKVDVYKDIEYDYTLSQKVKEGIIKQKEQFNQTFIVAMIISVVLLVLSPVTIFVVLMLEVEVLYGVVGLLVIIAFALFVLIYYGGINTGYNRLLKVGLYSKRASKVVNVISSIVWPLAVIAFLITGFVYNLWYINWLIFPITGLLFGIFSESYKIIKEK